MTTLALRVRTLKFPRQDGCVLFMGHLTEGGYGRLRVGGKMVRAHRYSYEMHKGPIGDLVVRHTCDNPQCINPEHLVLGTQQDNADDMVARGRQAVGARHSKTRLTEDDIRLMFSMRRDGAIHQEIADAIGVNVGHVSRVLRGKSWGHLGLHEKVSSSA